MLSRADRVLGALVVLKAIDTLLRGPGQLGAAGWTVALLLFTGGGVALLVLPSRPAWAAVVAGGLLTAADAPIDLQRQHLVLLLLAGLGAVVARTPDERGLLWRVLVTVLYATAALAKTSETFLGGDVLAVALRDGPLPVELPVRVLVALGVVTIGVEAVLAAAPWSVRAGRVALPLAAALHGSALLLLPSDPLVALRLLFFGGVSGVLVAVCRCTGAGRRS